MVWAAVAVGVGTAVVGGVAQADAANKAQQAGQDGANQMMALSQSDKARSLALSAPGIASGQEAMNARNAMLGLPQQDLDSADPYNFKGLDDGLGYDWNEGTTKDPNMRFRYGDDVQNHPILHGNQSDSDNDMWNRFITGSRGAGETSGFQDFYAEFGNSVTEDDFGRKADGTYGKAEQWYRDYHAKYEGGKEKHIPFTLNQLKKGIGQYDKWAELNAAEDLGTEEEQQARKEEGAYDWQTSPGYAFRLAEGNKALQQRQSAQTSYLSGASTHEAIEYNQGAASAEFDNVFRQLGEIAGMGVQYTGLATNQAAQQGAYQAASDYGAYGASGAVARGNAIGNAAQGIGAAVGGANFGGSTSAPAGMWDSGGGNAPGGSYGNAWTDKYAADASKW